MRNIHKVIVPEHEWERQFGCPKSRWEDIIKMDLKDTGCEAQDWIHLAHKTDQ